MVLDLKPILYIVPDMDYIPHDTLTYPLSIERNLAFSIKNKAMLKRHKIFNGSIHNRLAILKFLIKLLILFFVP